MSDVLEQMAADLANARQQMKAAKKFIEEVTPLYFSRLNDELGKGAVTFEYDGQRYGRVIAEKAVLNIERLLKDHPEFFGVFIVPKQGVELDEQALKEYLAANPDKQALIAQYIETTYEERWKNPVLVRDE